MVFEIVNPFSWIFNAISSEQISMPFLTCQLYVRTVEFSPPAESWLVNSNFPRASRMQGICSQLCSELMEKVSFSASKTRLALAERARFCLCFFFQRKVMKENSLLWYRVNLRVFQTMLNHNQNLFLIVSYCFCLFGEFANVFEYLICIV